MPGPRLQYVRLCQSERLVRGECGLVAMADIIRSYRRPRNEKLEGYS